MTTSYGYGTPLSMVPSTARATEGVLAFQPIEEPPSWETEDHGDRIALRPLYLRPGWIPRPLCHPQGAAAAAHPPDGGHQRHLRHLAGGIAGGGRRRLRHPLPHPRL